MSSVNTRVGSERGPEQRTQSGRVDRRGALAAEVPEKTSARCLIRVLRNREFALFWSGQAISQTGTWMEQFAQGWVVTTLAGSAFALASVNFAAAIPMLLLMPFGGVVADRMERRRVLLVTQWVWRLDHGWPRVAPPEAFRPDHSREHLVPPVASVPPHVP